MFRWFNLIRDRLTNLHLAPQQSCMPWLRESRMTRLERQTTSLTAEFLQYAWTRSRLVARHVCGLDVFRAAPVCSTRTVAAAWACVSDMMVEFFFREPDMG